jgi:hypothetical protein
VSFFIQHGYGKSNKIAEIAQEGNTDGVILSPADEDADCLRGTVADLTQMRLRNFLDPQTFIYSLNPKGSGRCHNSHGLELGRIHWSADAQTITRSIEAVRCANEAAGVSPAFIAPTCLQSSFGDVWTPLALQFARTSSATWGADHTIASVVIDEGALSDWSAVADWLDVATTLEVKGFYFIVNRTRRDYPTPAWDPVSLCNLLRLLYNLAYINQYEVIWGYSDLEGLIGLSSGINAIASGWHYTLRTATTQKWQPAPTAGRQPPAPRVHVGRLWSSMRAQPEVEALFRTPLRDEIFSSHQISRLDNGGFASWARAEAQVQHLRLLARRASAVTGAGDPSARVNDLLKSLAYADYLFGRIEPLGVSLPPSYRAKVRSFTQALEEFAQAEAL